MAEHEDDQEEKTGDQKAGKPINDPLTQGDAEAPQVPWQGAPGESETS
ncbi:MAG: hypothetical protein ABR540_06005 [Acidimicrobiales bacterium]